MVSKLQWLKVGLYISIVLLIVGVSIIGLSFTKIPRRTFNALKNTRKSITNTEQNTKIPISTLNSLKNTRRSNSNTPTNTEQNEIELTSSVHEIKIPINDVDISIIKPVNILSDIKNKIVNQLTNQYSIDLNEINNLFFKTNNIFRNTLPKLKNKEIIKHVDRRASMGNVNKGNMLQNSYSLQDISNIKLASENLKNIGSKLETLKMDLILGKTLDTEMIDLLGANNPYTKIYNSVKFSIDIDEVKMIKAYENLRIMKKQVILENRKKIEYGLYNDLPDTIGIKKRTQFNEHY